MCLLNTQNQSSNNEKTETSFSPTKKIQKPERSEIIRKLKITKKQQRADALNPKKDLPRLQIQVRSSQITDLDSIRQHTLFGDIMIPNEVLCCYGNNSTNIEKIGILSSLNRSKNISQIQSFGDINAFKIQLQCRSQVNQTNHLQWQILVNRLRALNDQVFARFASQIELYSNYMIQLCLSLQIQSTINQFQVPVFQDQAQFEQHVTNQIQTFNMENYHCREITVDYTSGEIETTGIWFNQRLLKVLGHQITGFEKKAFQDGIIEIFDHQNYMTMWQSLFANIMGDRQLNSTVNFLDKIGNKIKGTITDSQQIMGLVNGNFIILTVTNYEFDKLDEEKILETRKFNSQFQFNGEYDNSTRSADYDYQIESFFDRYYPNSFPKNYRKKNQEKISIIKQKI